MRAGRLVWAIALAVPIAPLYPAAAQQTLNIRDADIKAFIQDAARHTGRTFIIDSRVSGKVSVVTDRPLSRSEYFEIFLATLRANGLVAIPVANGAYRIQPAEGAAGQAALAGETASRNLLITEIFRIRSIDAASVLETIRPLVSKDGSATANIAGNSLVITDFGDNIARIRGVIARIDKDDAATTIIPMQNANASEIATSLQALAGGESDAASPRIVAIAGSNSIAIRGEKGAVERISIMVRDLDRQAASDRKVQVYWLQHADAETLLPVLQQVAGQTPAIGSAAPSGTGGAGSATPSGASPGADRGNAVVTRYEGANAIVASAGTGMQRVIADTIAQLDSRRDQVLVEAIIVEIGQTAARELGVQFLLGSTTTGFAATNYSNANPNLLTLAGAYAADRLGTRTTTVTAPDGTVTRTEESENSDLATSLQQAAANTLLNASGGFGGVARQIGDNGVFATIINAVRSDGESNILSTPSVTTLDNQKASLMVGQEIPVVTGEALSSNFDNQFRTIQREKVGIQLEVKPQINAGGAIKLFLRQEVSSIAGPVSSDNSDLVINKREIETTVTVDDGEILALGGLLDDNERRTIERIPLLSDIPMLGELFKSRGRSRSKTNLMIFIRPTILRSKEDAAAMSARRYGYIRDQQVVHSPGVEPSIDTLVREYMGAVPPGADRPRNGDEIVRGGVQTPEVRKSTTVVRPVEPASADMTDLVQ